jgi:AcrR family transcriptional regulator
MVKRKAIAKRSLEVPSLDTSLPLRQRGKDTFELILSTTGQLLEEVGFEKLTTNLVSERAGLTPPTLYRYFPNKYALLAELANRLMDAQDEAVIAWIDSGGFETNGLEDAVQKLIVLRKQIMTITRGFPGSVWILRAIRAVPMLQDVRIASRNRVLDYRLNKLRTVLSKVDKDTLVTAVRLAEQTGYAMVEMIMDDPSLNEDKIIEEASWMTALYYDQLADRDIAVSTKPRRSKGRGK